MNYQFLNSKELIALLFVKEDRLSREVVNEFINRGERMIEPLKKIVSERIYWTNGDPDGWGVIHATYILGAIGGEKVVIPLLRALRFASVYDCDWVSEYLPTPG